MPKPPSLRACPREIYVRDRDLPDVQPCALAWGHAGPCRSQEYVDASNERRRRKYRERAGHTVKKWTRYASE